MSLEELADEYIRFRVEGKELSVPYAIASHAINKFGVGEIYQPSKVGRYKNYAGKGTAGQIRQALISMAKRRSFDLKKASAEEIRSFMLHNGIGIDCSGFVYNVLDGYLRHTKRLSLDDVILRYPGPRGVIERRLRRKNRVRRCSAATLTNDLNTVKIVPAADIRPGDMLRLTHADWKGKHIGIVIEVRGGRIVYAMSSECTETTGTHRATIEVTNAGKGLEEQRWLEVTKDGQNYGQFAFDPARGDSVRRLKFLSSGVSSVSQ